jgi:cystathionine beta-lyase/cystathionine gamma-synthase/D-alanyl-D-alanine dipeptidase
MSATGNDPLDLQNNPEHALVPVTGVRPALQHHLWGVRDAVPQPFVARPLIQMLAKVAEALAEEDMELVIWDAYRAPSAQERIFDDLLAKLSARQATLSPERARAHAVELARAQAVELVGERNGVYPHGTGGAVAVTLAKGGAMVEMASAFEELGEQSSPGYFSEHEPVTVAEKLASGYRELLRTEMQDAGFVAHPRWWWAYEHGTARWAPSFRAPFLSRVLMPPLVKGPMERPPLIPVRHPALQTGVAQPALSYEERTEAYASRYRYVRESHQAADAFADFLTREILGGEGTLLCSSGRAAVGHALATVLEPGQALPKTLLYAKDVYLGSRQLIGIRGDAKNGEGRFHVIAKGDPLEWLKREDEHVDCVLVDSPSNWGPRCFDIHALAQAAHERDAKLIVDVTVQPCQPALAEGADIVVCSLSKDVSYGFTMGGALATSDRPLLGALAKSIADSSEVLAPAAVHMIHEQAFSLRDRLRAHVDRVEKVASFLEGHSAVEEVNIADAELCGKLLGSMLTFDLRDLDQGARLERAIGQRALDPAASLHLMGTFGGPMTSIEHYGSTAGERWEAGNARTNPPERRVRLGLGYQSAERIVAEIGFMLEASKAAPPAAHDSNVRRA